jgi:hypothetical protein
MDDLFQLRWVIPSFVWREEDYILPTVFFNDM